MDGAGLGVVVGVCVRGVALGLLVAVGDGVEVADGVSVGVGVVCVGLGDSAMLGARGGAGVWVGAARAAPGAAMLNTSDPTAATSDRRITERSTGAAFTGPGSAPGC
jgi:hypothetical protein